jgi:hypothetical protein
MVWRRLEIFDAHPVHAWNLEQRIVDLFSVPIKDEDGRRHHIIVNVDI